MNAHIWAALAVTGLAVTGVPATEPIPDPSVAVVVTIPRPAAWYEVGEWSTPVVDCDAGTWTQVRDNVNHTFRPDPSAFGWMEVIIPWTETYVTTPIAGTCPPRPGDRVVPLSTTGGSNPTPVKVTKDAGGHDA